MNFKECDTCAAKPGTPTLCDGCLNNRTVISHYKLMLSSAYGKFGKPVEVSPELDKAIDAFIADKPKDIMR